MCFRILKINVPKNHIKIMVLNILNRNLKDAIILITFKHFKNLKFVSIRNFFLILLNVILKQEKVD